MDIERKVNASLNILQRTPVQDTEKNLNDLAKLLLGTDNSKEAVEDLYQKVDRPLRPILDTNTNRYFLTSEHNRDGDWYRSPWSNEYFSLPQNDTVASSSSSSSCLNPSDEGLFKPSGELRLLEEQANEVFESYCQMYYGRTNNEESISSVYLWNKGGGIQEGGFAGCFLIQKQIPPNDDHDSAWKTSTTTCLNGYWNSIHVVDVNILSGGERVKYELSTTVLLSMDIACDNQSKSQEGSGTSIAFDGPRVQVGASLTKQKEKICNISSTAGGKTMGALEHIANIGQMIEAVETELRSNLDALSIPKTREILHGIHGDPLFFSAGDRATAGSGEVGATSSGRRWKSSVSAVPNPMQAELMARLRQRSSS